MLRGAGGGAFSHDTNAHVPVKRMCFVYVEKMASGYVPILDFRTQYLHLSAVSLSLFFLLDFTFGSVCDQVL
jgi:hypothetical protein